MNASSINKFPCQVGKVFSFKYEKKNGELRQYRIIVDRINEFVFSGRCLDTGRIMNNMRFDSVLEY